MTLHEYEDALFAQARKDPKIMAAMGGDPEKLRAEVKRRAPAYYEKFRTSGEILDALLHQPNERTLEAIRRGEPEAAWLPVDLRTVPSDRWGEHQNAPLLLPAEALAALTDGRHEEAARLTAAHYRLAGTGWRARWTVVTGSIHLERDV